MLQLLALLLGPAIGATLVATLSPVEQQVNFSSNSFLVHYRIEVNGNGAVSFFPWKTPLDTIWEDIFDIRDARGRQVPYTGKVARRRPPTHDDLFWLEPGVVLEVDVDLTRSYLLPEDGNYTITLHDMSRKDIASTTYGGTPTYFRPNTISMTFSEVSLQLDRHHAVSLNAGQCDADQKAAWDFGYKVATTQHVPRAKNCTSSDTAPGTCPDLYHIWYGKTSDDRYQKVQKCWRKLGSNLEIARFDCCNGCGRNCGPDTYAFVFPDDETVTLHLCGAYFEEPDEQGGTLTHESSHFSFTCDTDDYEYGREDCEDLAENKPNKAIANADNYCFFGADA